MEVIGAGLGRTGTSSFCDAMDILGYNCHHMKRLLDAPTNESSKLFYKATLNKEDADCEQLYEGYNACADWTGCYFYKDLLARYPDVKVVLTERPFEKWYESMKNTIYKAIRHGKPLQPGDYHYEFRELSRKIILDGLIEDDEKFLDQELMRNYYEDHIKEIKRVVPESQLYCLQLGEGWEGLCSFLGKPVPDQPYPNINSTALFKQRFMKTGDTKAGEGAEKAAPVDSVPDLTVGDA